MRMPGICGRHHRCGAGDQYRDPGLGGTRRKGARHGQFRGLDDSGDVDGIARIVDLHSFASERESGALRALRKQKAPGRCAMPALRQLLKRPQTYLLAMAVLGLVCAADSFRTPEKQWTAKVYIAGVHLYQAHVSGLLSRTTKCRFTPTCSHYSVEAVEKFGVRQGLWLTGKRLVRCRGSVPLGTQDPVVSAQTNSTARSADGITAR